MCKIYQNANEYCNGKLLRLLQQCYDRDDKLFEMTANGCVWLPLQFAMKISQNVPLHSLNGRSLTMRFIIRGKEILQLHVCIQCILRFNGTFFIV